MHLRDLPLLVDQIRDAARVFILRTLAGTVRHPDLPLSIGKQRERELVFLGELRTVFARVEADPDDLCIFLLVFVLEVPEPGTFCGSPRCVGLREEPENHLPPLESLEADRLSGVIGGVDVWSGVARLEHFRASCEGLDCVLQHSGEGHL